MTGLPWIPLKSREELWESRAGLAPEDMTKLEMQDELRKMKRKAHSGEAGFVCSSKMLH